jgi:hypothetical protein
MAAWLAGCSLTVALAVVSTSQAPPDISTEAVVAVAAGYVADYQRQLTSVLADEAYTQEIVSQIPRDPQMPRARHESVVCEAKYSNFRRFATSVRIK